MRWRTDCILLDIYIQFMQQIYQQLTADEYRRARLMHVQREVEKLKREEAPPLEALSRAAIEALSEALKVVQGRPLFPRE